MTVFNLTDVEGVAGVKRWVRVRKGRSHKGGTPEKWRSRRLFATAVNAAIEGANDAVPEAQSVTFDGHGTGDLRRAGLHLNPRIILHGTREKRSYALDRDFDAFFVGQHAVAGVSQAPPCHAYYSRDIGSFRLDGRSCAASVNPSPTPSRLLTNWKFACLKAATLPSMYGTALRSWTSEPCLCRETSWKIC